MKTICIQIGNTDDKLTQVEWSNFIYETHTIVEQFMRERHFAGGSNIDDEWQNFCTVFTIDENEVLDFRMAMQELRTRHNQDSAAFLIGDTEFI